MRPIKHFKKLRFIALIAFFSLATTVVVAQDFGPIGFDDQVDDEGPKAPIDGFITLGLLAGAFFGGYKLRNHNEK